jgi:hypothetical protein
MRLKINTKYLKIKSLLISILLMCYACATSKNTSTQCHQISGFQYCEKNSIKKITPGIDGETGTIQSPLHVINYDCSSYPYAGPQNKEEYFMQTFRSYHYLSYFDTIHIDKKVQKLFRDSVKLISLKEIPLGSARCKSCNYEAMLKFKQFVSPIYFLATNEMQQQWSASKINVDTIQNFVIKTYQNDKEKGAYIREKHGDRRSKKLSLTLVSGDFETFIANVKVSLQKLQ